MFARDVEAVALHEAADQRRKLIFLARDPRAYDGTTTSDDDPAGVYVVDADFKEVKRDA